MDNEEKQIMCDMLWVLKDFCEETQCRFCPFHTNDEKCQFVLMPDRLTKMLERLQDEIESLED